VPRDKKVVGGTPGPGEANDAESRVLGVARRFFAQALGCKIRSFDIEIGTSEIRSCADAWRFEFSVLDGTPGNGCPRADPRVVNGLGKLTAPAPGHAEARGSNPEMAEMAEVRSAHLLLTARVRSAWLHEERQIAVSSLRPMDLPRVRRAQWVDLGADLAVRAANTIQDPAVRAADSDAPILPPRVSEVSQRLRDLPHSRHGVPPAEFNARDQEGFLKQAEELRGLSRGIGQIVAVFRRVPVELITRVRYSEASGGLIYALASTATRTRTRVHDVAAVRDNATGKIHLVPHKTRFTEAVLS
jgi:hypothetical protein